MERPCDAAKQVFNQSFNPTLPTHGGGVVVLGAAPDGNPLNAAAGITECGSVTDVDCAPGLSDGTGPGLRIDANLFQGNTAESGSGGGLRLQTVNGTEVQLFPNNSAAWNDVSVTNNIFVNNVAGWTGGGVSLQDALKVNFTNNTVVSNHTTASAEVLFNTGGAPSSQCTSTRLRSEEQSNLFRLPNNSVELPASRTGDGGQHRTLERSIPRRFHRLPREPYALQPILEPDAL